MFKARLISQPQEIDEETKQPRDLGAFTPNKWYKVYDVFDNDKGYTDFLVADDQGVFYWLKMRIFRGK